MLCFVPPIPADWEGKPPSSPGSGGTTTGIVLIILVTLCMLIMPFGWSASQTRSPPLATSRSLR